MSAFGPDPEDASAAPTVRVYGVAGIAMTGDAADPRFVMDHMLIRVGKYLRICGFDAVWDLGVRTHELIRRANAEGRVFVTRNRHIEENYPLPREWLFLDSGAPVGQFREIVRRLHLDPAAGLFRKCIRCNVALEAVPDRNEVAPRVHPNVLARHERFQRCPHCGTVFWFGSHVDNTCRKLGLPRPDPASDGR